jgi:hypothetical protein
MSKQKWRGRKVPKWLVRRAPRQAIGNLIPPDVCFGAGCPLEDLISRRLSISATGLQGTEGSNPPPSSAESRANLTSSITASRGQFRAVGRCACIARPGPAPGDACGREHDAACSFHAAALPLSRGGTVFARLRFGEIHVILFPSRISLKVWMSFNRIPLHLVEADLVASAIV